MRYSFLLAIALTAFLTTEAYPQTTGAGGQTGTGTGQRVRFPHPLFSRNEVASSLRFTQPQIIQLNQLAAQLQAQFAPQLDRANRMSGSDRIRAMMELQHQYNSSLMTGARPILPQPQFDRLTQLQLQFNGYASLLQADVSRQLQLSAAQTRLLQEAELAFARQLQVIQQRALTNLPQAQQMFVDLQRAFQARVPQLLTPAQQQIWRQLAGDPFIFQFDPNTDTIIFR
jgi:hypothetical protein